MNKELNYDIGFIENDYEELQVLLNMALEDCSESKVNEIWEVKYIQSTTNHSHDDLVEEDIF
ncbi:22600_t:CDS:2 [Dentiscutata erythropus]|uniref:22600_t:CDS:1 n=1 Tax=Dentiscutata erythropus TaxID=1348616 RepID=A0A9N9HZ81_9GLOM|nr:22600_t:CDS:2 [Dentiscutata erythropus]